MKGLDQYKKKYSMTEKFEHLDVDDWLFDICEHKITDILLDSCNLHVSFEQ